MNLAGLVGVARAGTPRASWATLAHRSPCGQSINRGSSLRRTPRDKITKPLPAGGLMAPPNLRRVTYRPVCRPTIHEQPRTSYDSVMAPGVSHPVVGSRGRRLVGVRASGCDCGIPSPVLLFLSAACNCRSVRLQVSRCGAVPIAAVAISGTTKLTHGPIAFPGRSENDQALQPVVISGRNPLGELLAAAMHWRRSANFSLTLESVSCLPGPYLSRILTGVLSTAYR